MLLFSSFFPLHFLGRFLAVHVPKGTAQGATATDAGSAYYLQSGPDVLTRTAWGEGSTGEYRSPVATLVPPAPDTLDEGADSDPDNKGRHYY